MTVHLHPHAREDQRTHVQLTDAAKILGLRVLDNIIVARKGHFSFQEAGLIR
jgi:DNA repair protein RadC